jgi:tRNA G10  N-methylase Trm11
MTSTPYLAILGRQAELGLLELESRLGADRVQPYGRQAVLVDSVVDVAEYGGLIKAGRVLYDGPAHDLQTPQIDLAALPMSESKTPFAFSLYGLKVSRRYVEVIGISLKKQIRARGSVRFIVPGEGTTVSAAQLKHNQVLERGFELLVVVVGQRMVIAQTTSIQDIDWYSKRDYDRPARSAKVGMLPPKLAKVLVNTTTAPLVVDPFCGTGVTLQEALLLGRDAVGSDLAPEMVDASRQNLNWLEGVAPTPLGHWSMQDATDAREVRLPQLDCAIVSEGYLGPNLMSYPSTANLAKIRTELRELYRVALRNWGEQLDPGAEIALCVPAWRTAKGWEYLGTVDDAPRLGYTIKVFKHVSKTVLYARPDQMVGRQLLLLRKN